MVGNEIVRVDEVPDGPDEDMTVDVDAGGKLCAITIEHATRNAGAPRISYEVI